jgi:hypothetical protein
MITKRDNSVADDNSVAVAEIAEDAPPLEQARARLAEEWQAAAPRTPAQVSDFYRTAQRLGADLEVWHATPERQTWTSMLVQVARQIQAGAVVDIGAGAGHDLLALRAALPEAALRAVEPNDTLAGRLEEAGIPTHQDATFAPIERADLLVCVDVLEHVPDPDDFLGTIARRARLGCVLFETVATADRGTPLHLAANAGWHPGHVLEAAGWTQADRAGRVRVWRRDAEAGRATQSLLLCAYRSVSADTMGAILAVCAGGGGTWRLRAKTGDALIARSRAVIVTSWYRETADDVFLMLDDDICLSREDADRLVELCRAGHPIVCGAYPVHDGAHLACRVRRGTSEITLGPGQPPLEIVYAATGCMAVHRRVIETLVASLPLCHATQEWSFYPLFQPLVVPNPDTGGHEWLSEDFGFSHRASACGFGVWLDPQTRLTHLGQAPISAANMAAMHAAISQA